MANGMLLVDIPGQFQLGRETAQRNRLASMQLDQAQQSADRQARVNAMLQEAGSTTPRARPALLHQMATQGPEGLQTAQQLQQFWGGLSAQEQAQFQQGLQEQARLLSIAKSPDSYQAARAIAIQMDPAMGVRIPEQFDPNWVQAQINRVRDIENILGGASGRPSAVVDREDLLSRLPVNLDGTLKDIGEMTAQEQAIAIEAGIIPRATGSAAITTATTPGLTQRVATSEGAIAGRKAGAGETAKLESQMKLKPQVESAVRAAINEADAQAKIAEEGRSNAKALAAYDSAIQTLATAMGETTTGPIAGLMPALTAKQQTADAMLAAMAPILKNIFRAAGEGAFSDADQKLLLDMIPTRRMHPEARAAAISNIDAIVRSKLGTAPVTGDAAPTSQQSPIEGARQAPDGNWYVEQNGQFFRVDQ